MSDTTFDITTITDDILSQATTADLRKIATDADLPHHDTHVTVLDVVFGPELASTPGTLTAVDKAITAVLAAFKNAGRDPRVTESFGRHTEVRAWVDDEGLRSSIRWARDRVIAKAELAGSTTE